MTTVTVTGPFFPRAASYCGQQAQSPLGHRCCVDTRAVSWEIVSPLHICHCVGVWCPKTQPVESGGLGEGPAQTGGLSSAGVSPQGPVHR